MGSSQAAHRATVRDPSEHPAAQAWLRSHPRARVPTAVTDVKPQRDPFHKTGVYRLHGVGPGGAPIIAKRCLRETALHERFIYEHVLPRLPLDWLQLYGSSEEDRPTFCWLFLEDAGQRRPTEEDLPLLVRRLARLHVSAADVSELETLPDRGPRHYLEQLHAGVASLRGALGGTQFTETERRSIHRFLGVLRDLESRWPRIEAFCAEMPQTLVHGDLSEKNVRLVANGDGGQIQILDWETAGRGVPAADLAQLTLHLIRPGVPRTDIYHSIVEPAWHLEHEQIVSLRRIGRVFRLIASVEWAAQSLQFPRSGYVVSKMRFYVEALEEAMEEGVLRARRRVGS